MAKLPKAVRAEIAEKVDLVQLIGRYVELKKVGKEYVGLSPLTNEKTPSFSVVPNKGFWHDFSSGKHGDALSFLIDVQGKGYRDSVEEAAAAAGVDVRHYFQPEKESAYDKRMRVLRDKTKAVLDQGAKTYQRALLGSEADEARQILRKRGFKTSDLMRYRIGFAPAKYSIEEVESDVKVRAGIEVEREDGSRYNRFRNRIMFPITNQYGDVVSFGARAIGEVKPKYLNGPETDLFKKSNVLYGLHEALEQHRGNQPRLSELVMVEGYIDVISLNREGIPAVAQMSAVASEEQLRLAARYADVVYQCGDGDRAGATGLAKSLERVLPLLGESTTEFRFIYMTGDFDPDKFIVERGVDAYRNLMAQSLSATQACISAIVGGGKTQDTFAASERFMALTPEMKVAHLRKFGGLLNLISDEAIREIAAHEVAKISGLSKSTVLGLLSDGRKAPQVAGAPASTPASSEHESILAGLSSSEDDSSHDSASATSAQAKPAGTSLLQHMRLSVDEDEEIDFESDAEDCSNKEAAAHRERVLRRAPALRAAQLCLHYQVLPTEWDEDFVSSEEVQMLAGGDVLQAIVAQQSKSRETNVGTLMAMLSDDESAHWLDYIVANPPMVGEKSAQGAFNALIRHAKSLVRDHKLHVLMSASATRALNDDENQQLASLLESCGADIDGPQNNAGLAL